MFEKIIKSLDKESLSINELSCEYDQDGIYINSEVRGNRFYMLVQNQDAPEIDITFGPLKRFKTEMNEGRLISYIQTIVREINIINNYDGEIKFKNKKILFIPTTKIYIFEPSGLHILGQ